MNILAVLKTTKDINEKKGEIARQKLFLRDKKDKLKTELNIMADREKRGRKPFNTRYLNLYNEIELIELDVSRLKNEINDLVSVFN